MENIFTGNKIIENCLKIKELTKNNGFAILNSVSKYNSNNIRLELKISVENKITTHTKNIFFNDGVKFIEEITNIGLLIVNSNKKESINGFKKLTSPFKILTNEQGQPIVFSTNDEFEYIKEVYGENTTFIWKPEDADNRRIAIQFINIETFIDNLIKILKNNIGDIYYSVKSIGLSIGKIKWKKENEFGILIDYKSNYEFFFHKNLITNINELNEGNLVYFFSSYHLNKEEITVNKINYIGDINSLEFYDNVFEQFRLIKANSGKLSSQTFNQLEKKLEEIKQLISTVTDQYLQNKISINDFNTIDKFFSDGLHRVLDASRFNYFFLIPIETYIYDILEKDYYYSVLAKLNKKNHY